MTCRSFSASTTKGSQVVGVMGVWSACVTGNRRIIRWVCLECNTGCLLLESTKVGKQRGCLLIQC